MTVIRLWHKVRVNEHQKHKGAILIFILIFGAAATIMIVGGVASYAIFEHKASLIKHNRDLAFDIAEAGTNYYRWHLAHTQDDYMDGTDSPGPYTHAYVNKDGETIGYYALSITPPLTGSTIVTISSTGWLVSAPSVRRTVVVRVGFPALTNYTFLVNGNMSFSSTTVVHGEVLSNGGIRFDAQTDAAVESARSTYTLSGVTHPGVWGSGGPTSFWNYPVPAQDFNSITADLADLRTEAIAAGIYLASSGAQGWQLVFLTNGTFDLYRVNTRQCAIGYTGTSYCYDIGTRTFVQNYTIPANGSIFVEDDVFVEGTVNGRVTIGAGRFPVLATTYRDIIITNNLVYRAQASDDVIGLIAQRDVVVPRNVPNTMEIDAAALAQFGSIYRPDYYRASARSAVYTNAVRNSLTFFGSQIAYTGTGWKYVVGGTVISGFVNTSHVYDGNLRYYTPPGFPVGNVYDLLSWEEVE